MIEIDGSHGEGGGQILRTSVALSAYTEQSVRVVNIRAGRGGPGLRPQHLSAVKAVADLCQAEVEGAFLGSREIVFKPKKISAEKVKVDVGTAGSVTLVLQSLLFPSFFSGKEVVLDISGGTDVHWSPSIDYLRHVTLPLIAKAGFNAKIDLLRRGYYPAGGGRIRVTVSPASEKKGFSLIEAGKIKDVKGISHAHNDLENQDVAGRQAKTARNILFNSFVNKGFAGKMDIATEYIPAESFGSGLTLWAETENSIFGSDSVGEKGKRAEEVAREAAEGLINALSGNAGLDKYMGDQIIPYLAVCGGAVRPSEITMHTKTNIDVVNRFGFDVSVEDGLLCSGK